MSRQIRLWRELIISCWKESRLRTCAVLALLLMEMLSFAAASLGLRSIVDGAAAADDSAILLGAVAAGTAYAIMHTLVRVRVNLRIQLVERVGLVAVDADILRTTTRIETIDHLERSDYLDRVALVRGQGWTVVDSAWAAIESVAYAVQFLISLVLLATISPWLIMLLPFAAVPFWLSRMGHRRSERAETAAARPLRMQRHLFELCTQPGPAKEIRVAGSGPELIHRQAAYWREMVHLRFRARMTQAAFSAIGWGAFTAGYIAGIAFVTHLVATGDSTMGEAVMAITLASQLRGQVEVVVGRTGQALDSTRVIEPYLWLKDFERSQFRSHGSTSAPESLRNGISLQDVGFTYPGSPRPALRSITTHLPAGSVVAIVGEYGSGKTTLIKLLTKMYRPDSGAITINGIDLADIDAVSWRCRLAAAFQDFGRYQTTLRCAIGLGDLSRIDDRDAVQQALRDGGGETFVAGLSEGIDTQLGATFNGVDLSEGQWQKVALARACMRPAPLLFILDEPTASLDAPSEHEIFLSYARRARHLARSTGAVTVLISHRFSTISMADHILVMREGRIVEAGDHAGLMEHRGLYSELYELQEYAYAADRSPGKGRQIRSDL